MPKANALPIEETKLAIVCDSNLQLLQGVIEGLIKSLDRNAQIVFVPADLVWAETGAQILVNGTAYGTVGIVSEKVRDKFDLKDVTPVAAEIDFEQLSTMQAGPVKVKPIPKFPAIERDLSIVVDEAIAWADISEAVDKKASAELEAIHFVGIYRGKGIPSGKKSVTLTLTFRDEDGTLTHEAVDRFEANIVDSLAKSVAAELRTI